MEGLSKFQHTRVFDDKIATHVVTGVLYGAEAFFVFDRQVSESESYRDIHGRVEAMVKALPSIDLEIGGSAEVGIKQGEKEEASKFECTFYGDFLLKKNPSTFEEAVQVYRELPQLLGLGRPEQFPAAECSWQVGKPSKPLPLWTSQAWATRIGHSAVGLPQH